MKNQMLGVGGRFSVPSARAEVTTDTDQLVFIFLGSVHHPMSTKTLTTKPP